MDIQKTGAFIAGLRRERGLTQQQLGDIVGATNKTVSRWETGSYMPPVEVLEILSREFGVTINELVAGQRLSDGEFKGAAERNLMEAISEPGAFGLGEKISYFKRKWLKDHIFEIIAELILIAAAGVALWFIFRPICPVICLVLGIIGAANVNNSMMAYVERKAFTSKGGAEPDEPDRGLNK